MGNGGGWTQDLWRKKKKKAQMIYKHSFSGHSTTNSGEGKEMHTAPSAPLETLLRWYPQASRGRSLSLCQTTSPELSQGILT